MVYGVMRGMAAEVRMYPGRRMVTVVVMVVVVEMGVQQRRPKGGQLQSDGRRHRDDRAKHRGHCSPGKPEDSLNSSSEAVPA